MDDNNITAAIGDTSLLGYLNVTIYSSKYEDIM